MGKPLRVLIIEDSEDDARLVLRELERNGYDPISKRVETREAMSSALKEGTWDIVISDYTMPHFSAPDALKLLQGSGLDLPFIVVTGTVGEETVVEVMKSGAHDYILKGNLKRFVVAIERELREAEVRRERKQAEEKLRESERKLKALFEILPVGVSILDAERNIVNVNPSMESILGISRDGLFKGDYKSRTYLKPDGTPMLAEEYASARAIKEQRAVHNVETGVVKEDGNVIWTNVSAVSVAFPDWKVVIVTADITERKQAEEALRQSEEKFRSLVNSIKLGISRATPEPDGIYLEVNPTMTEITGYSREELLQMKVADLFANPEERKTVLEEITSAKGPIRVEMCFRKKDGSIILVRGTPVPIRDNAGKVIYVDGIIEDITEHRLAEKRLQGSEEKYRGLVENIKIGIFRITAESPGKFLEINPAISQITGYSREELFQLNVADLYAQPEDRKAFLKQSSVKDTVADEVLLRKKNGTEIIVARSVTPVKDNSGKVLYFDGIIEDITEQKKAEDALRQSEDKFVRLFRMSPVAMRLIELDSAKTVDANDSLVKLTGYSRDEIIGHTTRELGIIREPPTAHAERVKTIKKYGRLSASQISIFTKSGEERICLMSSELLNLGGKDHTLNVLNDITEQRKMQEQLMAQDRLASIGQLVSGVAHEINNPLTGVIGFSEMLLKKNLPADVKDDLKVINDEAQRTARIVKNLLTFARKQPEGKTPLDINEVIRGVLNLRDHEQKVNNIRVITHFASDLPQVMGNSSQLQQVVFNIVINAEFFMLEAHQKGNLTITTERIGDSVRATLADDGAGISQKNMKNLFIPFFTAKEVGKGTGLGLSICHGIITEHGGRIYAESEFGKGATFIVELPIAATRRKKR